MSKTEWEYLSYELTEELTNYGGAKGIEIEWLARMDKGNTSTNSLVRLPAHTGTHIDYPLHFFIDGKTGSNYTANELSFTQTSIIDISGESISDYLINNIHLENHLKSIHSETDFLIIKTGFTYKRETEEYWKYNWGFAPETAGYLKQHLPQLKGIGFDLISLSSYQQRETGRIAHKQFLEIQDILIVEDLDLKKVTPETQIETLIISPLRFKNADGAPVNVIAQILL